MTSEYNHQQFGKALIVMVLAISAGVAVVCAAAGVVHIILYVLPVLVVMILLFHSLRVEVDGEYLRLRFGIGLIRKKWEIAEIGEAYPVRSKWYYGLGIRLTPSGWLYAVSGLDAVEVVRVSGRRFRIGTDEPAVLSAVLNRAIGGR